MVNDLIRALLARTGGWLSTEDRAAYVLLRDEWTIATAAERARPEIVEAA